MHRQNGNTRNLASASPATHTQGSTQVSNASSIQTGLLDDSGFSLSPPCSHTSAAGHAGAARPKARPPDESFDLSGVQEAMHKGAYIWKYTSEDKHMRRHERLFKVKGAGDDARLTWRSGVPGWSSVVNKKARSVKLTEIEELRFGAEQVGTIHPGHKLADRDLCFSVVYSDGGGGALHTMHLCCKSPSDFETWKTGLLALLGGGGGGESDEAPDALNVSTESERADRSLGTYVTSKRDGMKRGLVLFQARVRGAQARQRLGQNPESTPTTQPGARPHAGTEQLRVTVLRGASLPMPDDRGLSGETYFTVTCGGETRQSDSVGGGKDPIWEQEYGFGLSNEAIESGLAILVSVYWHNPRTRSFREGHHVSDGWFIGAVRVPVQELIRDGVKDKPQDSWYTLKASKDGSGKKHPENALGHIAKIFVRFWMPGKSPVSLRGGGGGEEPDWETQQERGGGRVGGREDGLLSHEDGMRYEILDAFGVEAKSRPHLVELHRSRHDYKDIERLSAKEHKKLESAWERIEALSGVDGAISTIETEERMMLSLMQDIDNSLGKIETLTQRLHDSNNRHEALTQARRALEEKLEASQRTFDRALEPLLKNVQIEVSDDWRLADKLKSRIEEMEKEVNGLPMPKKTSTVYLAILYGVLPWALTLVFFLLYVFRERPAIVQARQQALEMAETVWREIDLQPVLENMVADMMPAMLQRALNDTCEGGLCGGGAEALPAVVAGGVGDGGGSDAGG